MDDTNTPILDYHAPRRQMIPAVAWSLMLGGSILFVAPLAVAAVTDAQFLDFTPLLLAGLGYKIWKDGRRAAASGALVLTTLYGLAGVAALSRRGIPIWIGTSLRWRTEPPLILLAATNVAWSLATVYLVARWLWPLSDPGARRRRRALIGSLATLYLVAGASLGMRSWVKTQSVRNAPAMTTDVVAVDADTGNPVPITVGGPSSGTTDPWSTAYAALASNRMQIRWRATEPLPIRVSSPGYAEQEIILHTDAALVTTARLRRSSPPATRP